MTVLAIAAKLSKRQCEVALLVVKRKSPGVIAARLDVEVRTIYKMERAMRRRLGCKDREALIEYLQPLAKIA